MKILLKIDRVGGRALSKPVVLHLRGHGAKHRDRFKPSTRFCLLGYETGGFEGIPPGLFKYVPAFTGKGYHFNH